MNVRTNEQFEQFLKKITVLQITVFFFNGIGSKLSGLSK